MDRHILNNRAFSLAEMAIALSVFAIMLTAILAIGEPLLGNARVLRTEADLLAVARACHDFYGRQGQWPLGVRDLQPDFLSPAVSSNDYAFDPGPKILIISSVDSSQTVLKPVFR